MLLHGSELRLGKCFRISESNMLIRMTHVYFSFVSLQDVLRSCMEKVRANIPVVRKENLNGPGSSDPGHSMLVASDKLGELEQAETPTDVGDIHF